MLFIYEMLILIFYVSIIQKHQVNIIIINVLFL